MSQFSQSSVTNMILCLILAVVRSKITVCMIFFSHHVSLHSFLAAGFCTVAQQKKLRMDQQAAILDGSMSGKSLVNTIGSEQHVGDGCQRVIERGKAIFRDEFLFWVLLKTAARTLPKALKTVARDRRMKPSQVHGKIEEQLRMCARLSTDQHKGIVGKSLDLSILAVSAPARFSRHFSPSRTGGRG